MTPVLYAEVAINAAVQGTYHYHVPEKMRASLVPGHLVRVSFGTAMQPGIIVALHDQLPPELEGIQTKPIIALLDPYPIMTQQHIELARWMSKTYLTSLGACLWLLLPPGLTGHSTRLVSLRDLDAEGKTSTQAEIIALLKEHGTMKHTALQKQVSIKTAARVIREMEQEGILAIEAVLSAPGVAPKTARTVMRSIPEEEVVDALARLQRAPKQSKIFSYIARFDYPLDVTEVYEETGASSPDLKTLERKGLVHFGKRIVFRDSLADKHFVPGKPLALTREQQAIWEPIHAALQPTTKPEKQHGFLLHGVTGSGKTEIYLHAIAEVLAQGRQAYFLVPEIALTPQTIRRVAQRFPDQVAVVHGSLSVGERYDTWRRARKGEIGVIVGTRSALFTPLPDVGLIILDEEHDPSYKHAPPLHPPYYHARAVAEQMAKLNGALFIFGSATPDMETYYRAQNNGMIYLHLPSRIMGHRQRIQKQARQRHLPIRYEPAENDAMMIGLPPVDVIDMREELKKGNLSMFSSALKEALSGVIQRNEQAILFLNRRGQSSYVFCRDCGFVVGCENCDTSMTYHRHGDAMRCHHCGHRQSVPTICPECSSERIRYFGAGTQQVESEVRKLFPDVETVRWDADTASKPDLHEAILSRFANGEVSVMVGTQMIAKGLDLPLVTLVGVISADPGLALPDFRARERAFQLLTQVAGRAGRSILGGRVVIQTYQPEHPSIQTARHHDYQRFYEMEMEARRGIGYPPYRRMGRVLIQNAHPIEAQRQIEEAEAQLRHTIERHHLTDTHLIGPAPCFFSRIDSLYRWHILVRSPNPEIALSHLQVRSGWYLDLDPVDVL